MKQHFSLDSNAKKGDKNVSWHRYLLLNPCEKGQLYKDASQRHAKNHVSQFQLWLNSC